MAFGKTRESKARDCFFTFHDEKKNEKNPAKGKMKDMLCFKLLVTKSGNFPAKIIEGDDVFTTNTRFCY